MTRNYDFDATITTDGEMEAALTELLAAGDENGVNVTGAWVCSPAGDGCGWEANVVELDTGE